MLLVSDVHGAFSALARVAQSGEPLLVLGDFINFIDYRTNEGILADVLGTAFVRQMSRYRADGDYAASRSLWKERFGGDATQIRKAIMRAVDVQYAAVRVALDGAEAYATYGNVDWPALLRPALPDGVQFVDGEVIEVEGISIGMVGGGSPTPLGVPGEVSDDEMERKLDALGPVDVLCTHLPPDIPSLRRDVITGRLEGGSRAVLDYLQTLRPTHHYFGDIHQPQAARWRVGSTICVNVGYFRATQRPVRHEGP
ncbi:hypothetical protein BMS3Abin02_01039 [bacterium BMS3Abin02]|nr:hypothetical protein BMS3Abin02_01039 [bacterium BMS3Abin02]GBE23185.1 hypothetical protein BMS3Bbin01_02569 [bacterium BMS3Bbin01]